MASRRWILGLAGVAVLAMLPALLFTLRSSEPAGAVFTPPTDRNYVALDCNTAAAGIQSSCNTVAGQSLDVGVVIGNVVGRGAPGPQELAAVQFTVLADQTKLNPKNGVDTNLDANPDFNQAAITGGWGCNTPGLLPNRDQDPSPSIAASFLGCTAPGQDGPSIPLGGTATVAVVHYDALAAGATQLNLSFVVMGNDQFLSIADCNPPIETNASCIPAIVTVEEADIEASNNVLIDCDADPGVQSTCFLSTGTTSATVEVVFENLSGSAFTLGAFNFHVNGNNQALFTPVAPTCLPPGTDCNPDNLASGAGWSCAPPNPAPDADPSPTLTNSTISCFNGSGDGPSVPDGGSVVLGRLTVNVSGTGTGDFALATVNVFDDLGVEVHSCNPGLNKCVNGSITIGNPPTPTSTTAAATSTATNTVPAATSTNTATNTATATNTVPPATSTNTPTSTATNTPTATNTVPAATSTNTATSTATNTVPAATSTNTATSTATNTPTATNTVPAATSTNTATNTATATNTVPAATSTNTPTATSTTAADTATSTNTVPPNTATSTNTPTATNTSVPTATDTVPADTATSTATATSTFTATPTQPAQDFPWTVRFDCDVTAGGVQADCTLPGGTTATAIDVILENVSGDQARLGAFNFTMLGNNKPVFTPATPACSPPGIACNPDFNDGMGGAGWACSPPVPNPDLDNDGNASTSQSAISCFNAGGDGPVLAAGQSVPLGRVSFAVNGADQGTFTPNTVNVFDDLGVEFLACTDGNASEPCFGATVQTAGAEPTETSTSVATATNTAAATVTNTPLPTSTSTTVAATATNTAAATATNTPDATATSTSVVPATATSTAEPSATSTVAVPTATNTAQPTSTSTSVATATNTPDATSTTTPEATETVDATQTVETTRTVVTTRTVTTTKTPAVTKTPDVETETPEPTETPVTASPTATSTVATATNTAQPSSTATKPASTHTPASTATKPASTATTSATTATRESTVAAIATSPSGGSGGASALPDAGQGGSGGAADLTVAILSIAAAGVGLFGVVAMKRRGAR